MVPLSVLYVVSIGVAYLARRREVAGENKD
jgi:hypothetical protein